MHKPVIGIAAITAAVLVILTILPAHAANVFLRNGKIIQCEIIKNTATTTVVRTGRRQVLTIENKNILRILYTKLYMGRQYIRLTDGRVLQAYIVDEDRDNITFRENINKPVEFKIKRRKILFMARQNPNELTAEPDYTSIFLKWKPPVGKVKFYNIYLKEKNKPYPDKPAEITSGLSFNLDGVKSSTDYCIVVTAVNKAGKESLPSNEICLVTKNHPPEAPEKPEYIFGQEYWTRNGKKRLRATIQWKSASDSDGDITAYHVYIKKEAMKNYRRATTISMKRYRKIRKPPLLKWRIRKLSLKEEIKIKVRSEDNRGVLSTFSPVCTFNTENIPPEPPEKVKAKTVKKRGKTRTYAISWSEAKDRDGKIKEYRISVIKKGKRMKYLGKTRSLSYKATLPFDGKDEDAKFHIRSVDNRGAVSGETSLKYSDGFYSTLEASFLMPLGVMGEALSFGGGGLLSFGHRYWQARGFSFGGRTGYFYFSPRHEVYKSYSMIPLLATADYRFKLKNFEIQPRISFGMTTNITRYNKIVDKGLLVHLYDVPGSSRFSIHGLFMGGVSLRYQAGRHIFINTGAEYGGIIEKNDVSYFLSIHLGTGIWI